MKAMVHRVSKEQRQKELANLLYTNPFTTDDELAKKFDVSVQTIRLDRTELGIPELRERTKQVAEQVYQKVRSMTGGELVGELLKFERGKQASSIMEVMPEMVVNKSRVCRSDYLFSQANTLAVAIVDADIVLTGSARIRYRRPVYLNEKIVAYAFLARKKINKYLIKVTAKVGAEEVFVGKFIVVAK